MLVAILDLVVLLHVVMLALYFFLGTSEMQHDSFLDDEETEARITRFSRQLFWSGVGTLVLCVVFDVLLWRNFPLHYWLGFVAFDVFCLWGFAVAYRDLFRKSGPPENKDEH